MLLKGKWVLVKQESSLWWHVLRWGEVIWPTAGTVYVSNVSWNATCDLCRRENTKDWGLGRMHVKIIPFMLYSSCITSARKSLENAKQWWVILLNLSQHRYWGHLGVESWHHEISVGATRASHSMPQSVHEGRSGADLPLQDFTSSWSLPPCSPSLRHMGSPTPMQPPPSTPGPTDPHGPPVSAFPAAPCTAAAWSQRRREKVAWRVMAHAYTGVKKMKGNLYHIAEQPPVQISKKEFTLGLGGTSRLVYWHVWR